jgi:hypothetical protein
MRYRVVASLMSLRDFPASNSNVIAQIPFMHTLKLIEKLDADWLKVRLLNTSIEGYALSSDLELIDETTQKISEIEIPNFELGVKASLDSKEETYKPIPDPTIPYRDLTSPDTKRSSIEKLIHKLNVSENFRYQKDEADTYCNVYAFDFCFFARVYVPRLRWTDLAIEQLEKGQEVPLVFDETVKALYSNYCYDWFVASSEKFGWKRIHDADELQLKVNENGGVGVLIAKRFIIHKSGHIVVVVPETETEKAFRVDGKVVYPLQSQAGLNNYNYFSENRKDWWNNKDPENGYSSHIFYYHD